jgi:hypothetical protein
MSRCWRIVLSVAALLPLVVPASAGADERKRFETELSGFGEVHPPALGIGAIFSTGGGRLKLRADERAREIRYELTYEFPDAGLTPVVGAQFVNQAHLHFGQKHTTGGITVWLCQSLDNAGPAGTPICPSPSGAVSGIIRPANVLGIAAQGLPGGEAGFDALLDALRNGAIYGNVHTDRFGPGEIRGQLGDHHHDH